MSEALLQVRSLTSGYGDITAIRDVSFEVPAGSITALLGRNGAGKTTTMRALSGLNRAAPRSIVFKGEDISGLPPYGRIGRGIGFVQEGKRIFRSRTVEENLLLGAYSRRLPRRKLDASVESAYARFPVLAKRRREPAGVLSGGQQQMLAIAQALGSEPDLLLLDEPSVGLAPALVKDVLDSVGQLRDEGLAVLLVEQAVEVALEVADHVVVLDLGRVVHRGRRADPDIHTAIENAYFGRLAEMDS